MKLTLFIVQALQYVSSYTYDMIAGTCNAQMCNQQQYFENEKLLFNVDKRETPFAHDEYSSSQIDCFPTNAKDFVPFLLSKNDKLDVIPYNISETVPTSYVSTIAPYVWRLLGWSHRVYYDEEYWVYENNRSDNVVFYFHGLNAFDGLDNLYTLYQLTYHATVYFPIYKHIYITTHEYNHSFSEHVDNVFKFIDTITRNVSLVGHSFGSVRAASMCNRYDCSRFSRIVLLDPLNINAPFSLNFKQLLFGIFLQHNTTAELNELTFIKVMRTDKQRMHVINNYNWLEWSIDTVFLKKYKHNLVLVVSDNDHLLYIDKTSIALTELSNVIYTTTVHGLIILTRTISQIRLF
jgi:hypothetical protein